jgi:DHA3 family macrolide efflux protein-like MFS transporter
MAAASAEGRLWNKDFFLLWQGQLVSSLGDTIYAIALGFWVLRATGSTALMGALMAATALPRILVAPFAGVVIDRADRKRLLVAMDLLRGLAVVLVGLAAFSGLLRVWMTFAAGAVIGLGGAFFSPGVSSIVPSIVPRDRLVQANSSYSLIATGSGLAGNSAGGFLYQALGAPLMFLVNGLSYLVSAATLVFIRVPAPPRRDVEARFFAELREGVRFAWRLVGLRTILLTTCVLNFFGGLGLTLILPLFERTPELGPARYGITMACFTGGLFAGFLATGALRFRPENRFRVFMACAVVTSLALVGFALAGRLLPMLVLILLAGAANAVLNSFLMAAIQAVVPADMIGKVSALLMALSGALLPLAMAAAGGLAEVFPVRSLMAVSFFVLLLCLLPLFFAPSFRRFINFDPAQHPVDSLAS